MVRARSIVTLAFAFVGLTACLDPAEVALSCPNGEPICETRPAATGVDLERILLYQGVESAWMDGGAAGEPDLPVVAGRDLVVRGFVTPHDGFTSRDLVMVVYLFTDTTFLGGFEAPLTVSGPSNDADLTTTFNVGVAGQAVQEGARVQVKVLEQQPGAGGAEELGRVEFPAAGGDQPLTVIPGDHKVKIHLVPVQYDADGSGRLPDVSIEQIERYRSTMWAVYPAAEVEIEVGAPLPWSQTVSASGSGWDQLLSTISTERDPRGLGEDVYLYGAFNPTDDFGAFCAGGCVLGLSNLAMAAGDSYSRASIGVGFTGDDAAWTMVHEIGHAHGRSHAPCGGAAGPDPNFPYDDGGIGSRGLDLRTLELKEVDTFKDFMGYCSPNWLADYTFVQLHDRIVGVNELGGSGPGLGRTMAFASLWWFSDGTTEWGPDVTLRGAPGGLPIEVERFDDQGQPIDTVDAAFSPFDHVGGGRLIMPLDRPFTTVRFEGAEPSPAR